MNGKTKILLIEDNPGDARLIREMLKDSGIGFELFLAERLSKALEYIANIMPDVILLDLALPDSWGIDTFLKVQGKAPSVPIIILTVFDIENLALNAVKSGAQDYLIKDLINSFHLRRSIKYAIERNKSEIALRKSEEKHRLLLENLNDIIYQADNEGNITYMNKKGLEALECTEEEMIGQPGTHNLHPDDLNDAMKAYKEMLENGRPIVNYECRFAAKRGKGRIFPVIQNIIVLKDNLGNIIGTQGIARDISIIKQAEEELRNVNKQLLDIIDFLPDATFVIDKNMKVIAWNRAIEVMTSICKKDIIGKADYSYAMPFYGIKRPILIDMVFYDEENIKSNYNYFKKDCDTIFGEAYVPTLNEGKGAHLWGVASPLRDNEGEIIGAIESIRDITEWKLAEQALMDSEERLKLSLESANLGIWDWNVANDEINFDDRIPEMLGYSPEDFDRNIDMWLQLIHPEDLLSTDRAIKDHINGKIQIYTSQYRLKCKDGQWLWVHERGKIVSRDENGNPLRAIGIIMDISEMRRYQDALEEAYRKLNLLSGITRHDISNQVTGLMGYILLLNNILPQDPKIQEYMERISIITDGIKNQIRFAQDYKNMGAKQPEWQNLEEMVKRVATSDITHGIELEVAVDSLEILADPMLEKVFFNLFENASRHGEHVTRIQVSFHEEDGEGIIMVEDDGVGIPKDEKDHIFERSFGKNTGYGLFLAKEILGITNMIIEEKGEEDKGARFEIIVPREYFRMKRE
jgi:PAS domain S-box-containing protein